MDNDYTEKNHKIDVMAYEALDDMLDELASDEQEFQSILKNYSAEK